MPEADDHVAVVALTHEAAEADVQLALQAISDAGLLLAPTQLIRIAS